MKTFKFSRMFLAVIALLVLAANAGAQLAYDTYSVPRSIVPSGLPRILDASAATFTNGPIDVRGFVGTANIDVTSVTNAGGALTLTIYTSNDQTNLTALTNYAFIKATTSQSYTNRIYGGTNVYATNPYLLPGTLTTAAGGSTGFVGTRLDYTTVPFTNSGAATITAKGEYRIGVRAPDLQSYLYFVWTPTGSSSNDIVSAKFTGIPGNEVQLGQ